MGMTRAYYLAGLALASGLIAGCGGDCWCNGGSCKGTQPKTSQTTSVSSSAQQSDGWSNRQRSQDLNVSSATSQQSAVGGQSLVPQGQQSLGSSNVPAVGSGPVDPTPPAQSPVRPVSGTATPPAATNNPNPPAGTPPVTQRDSWPQSTPITAPSAPALPPPMNLPATGQQSSSTSKYPPLPSSSQPLPAEMIPNQSKIPTLPSGQMPVE